MAVSQPIVGCLVKKAWGVTGTPGPPLATPLNLGSKNIASVQEYLSLLPSYIKQCECPALLTTLNRRAIRRDLRIVGPYRPEDFKVYAFEDPTMAVLTTCFLEKSLRKIYG